MGIVKYLSKNRLLLQLVIALELTSFFVAGMLQARGDLNFLYILGLGIVLAFVAGEALAHTGSE